MNEMVNRVLRGLRDGLFPQHCLLCREVTERAQPLCRHCERALPVNREACACCALPLAGQRAVDGLCILCQEGSFDFDRVVAPFVYDEHLAFLVGRWKYARQEHLTDLLAALWLARAARGPLPDIVVPVPLHWRRLLWRGFNQAELLALALVEGHPGLRRAQLRTRLLRRRRRTRTQAGLGASGRAENAQGAFTLRGPCDNLHVAVVDDICTTGATADAVSRALRAGGARSVELWCLARTPPPHRPEHAFTPL
jgi:ComF family protein